jgi:hypothetical protein
MRFYIATEGPPSMFWNGRALSPEYPDAKLFPTRGKAYAELVKARTRVTNGGDLFIADNRESDPDDWQIDADMADAADDEPIDRRGPMHDATMEDMDRWARRYDDLNGAPENDVKRAAVV